MALTLAEAAKLSNDVVLQGVYESIVNASDIQARLPYDEMVGNAVTYNRENVAATVGWRAVGDVWTEDVATFTQITTTLTIVGGDADVDAYLQASRSNVQDLSATILLGKAQALQRAWDDKIINGDGAANTPTGIKSLISAVAAANLSAGVNGGALTLSLLDQLTDLVKGAAPDMLLMSRRSRRKINDLFRASGASMETRSDFGRFIQFFNGIPIGISDYIADTDVQGTSGATTSSIYALTFGQATGGIGALFNGGGSSNPIQIENVGALETKDATRTRVKAYVALAMYSTVKNARLYGILP